MSKFFVNRPIVAMVISIVLVLVGIIVMRTLPISQYPDIVPPNISVTTSYTGASSVDIEQSVATPLEQQINGVENMIYVKSINAGDGTMTLQVTFDVGSDLDNSNVLTQNRVSQATSSLPNSVKQYGVNVKKSLVFPLVIFSVTSKNGTYDNTFLSNYASINIIDQLSRTKGVGDVKLFGGSDYSMRIWLKPDLLGKMGITVSDISNAIQSQNVISPAGQVGAPPAPPGTDFTYTVRTKGRLLNEEEFGNIVVKTNPDGSQLFLKDVARIELGSLLYNMQGRNNSNTAAVLAVYQLPGSNALQVAEDIKKVVDDISKTFPPGIEYSVSLDTTLPVKESITEIVHTLVEAVLLVILVVFIFLQNWRATLIPLITVPVSLIATFIMFPLLGFSINTLSLLGMVLAIGIVVDDAIVVVEAVMHHIEEGMSPKAATLKAMEEVTSPVVAIALILAAVFIPVAFMGGITGRLYQQFAVTIAISVLFSAFNALTLSPALAAMLLKPKGAKKSPLDKFYVWFNKKFSSFTHGYMSITSILVRKTLRSVSFIAILIVFILLLFKGVPSGFVPEEDNGYFMASVILPDASSLQRTDEVCKKVEKIFRETETIDNFTTVVGYNFIVGVTGSNMGGFFVAMKPWDERTGKGETSFETINELNKRLADEIPEAVAFVFGPPAIQGLGSGAGFSMLLQDKSGNTPEALFNMTQKFIAAAKKRPEIGSITSFYRSNVPQIYADVDLDKAMKQGIDIGAVNQTLGTFLGSSYINDFNKFGRVYRVYLSTEGQFRDAINDIGLFFVKNNKGEMVPLNSIVSIKNVAGPDFTNRFNLYRSAQLTGVPGPGFSSGETLNALKEVAAEVLPAGWGYDWSDMSYQEEKAAGSGSTVFILALALVFLIMAAQYESWSLPLSVLLGTPFAIFGAMLGLWISRFFSESYVNNIYAQIGFITLIGLSAKNAILIVEFAKDKREKGVPIIQSALDAAELRLRPILMTSFAFILGVVPLVRAAGAGAESRKVMGMAVFAGLLVATSLAIFLVPALFVMVEKYFVKEKKKDSDEVFAIPDAPENKEKGDK
ncbi:MAG: multidrug efflux RND transporter permease subunit [Ignavibacteriae bacterium]|nr:multidrug efflux RND transporter permease subunit [Ignavibacteriota bacterium]